MSLNFNNPNGYIFDRNLRAAFANVSLYEHNTFQPFPVEYHGKYDIVNVRFMITLLDKEKVRLLLRSLKMILKPDDILQWFEPIAFNVKAVAPEGIEAPWNSKVAEIMRFNPPDCANWITLNCDMVKPEGYEAVAWDEFHLQEIHRLIWMQTCLMGMTEVVAGLAQSTDEADRAKREGLEQLMVGWEKEYEQGAYADMPWYFLVTRKPLEA
ncbi:hypothetical protein N7493_003664 [Penicillium malachiteum]|uniref:Uncharacterized protein n=1 Tax=Penicillium malachiteum TaxID=1324776 RepID=A0AAD6MXU2_9EURO|nr:hypothetical protein N7493_003664 [Penicillium malachiteum]